MNFIQGYGYRINLDHVVEYKAMDETAIVFDLAVPQTGTALATKTWILNSQQERDGCLEWLDTISKISK